MDSTDKNWLISVASVCCPPVTSDDFAGHNFPYLIDVCGQGSIHTDNWLHQSHV